MTSKYTPFIHRISSQESEEIFKDGTVMLGTNINEPLHSLGYHSFIHRTKSAMEITNKLETKNKFYYVVNPFEHMINDFPEDIMHISDIYFPPTEQKILSRAFYKMWEILSIFDIANFKNMTTVSIAEGPGSFIQAIIKYREKFFDITKDRIHCMTLHQEDGKNIDISKTLVDAYPKLINIFKTYKKTIADADELKTNGDIMKTKTINIIAQTIEKEKKYADLVTADGGFEWINENYQEQEAYNLIMGEIFTAIKIQAKDGNFVLKIFETFTNVTIKMMYLLTTFYEEVYIYKPFFSRSTNSEKYIVCRKFKYDQVKNKDLLDKRFKILEKTLNQMNTKQFIIDIFPKFILKKEQINVFKYTNILIANTQQILINMLVQYIKSNNYFGDEYHTYRFKQIEANKWWLHTFFTENKPEFNKIVKDVEHYNESELNLFVNKLIMN
jgi:23S rRNA U2552 (ribose-2'-O)-methylase RlmE/FtsJ